MYDLNVLADVYMVSQKTQHRARRVLWRVTVGDAMKICNDKRTEGRSQWGGLWHLVWTTHELDNPDYAEFVKDDGRFDKLLNELNIKVLKCLK